MVRNKLIKKILTESFLVQEYIKNQKSARKIAEECFCSDDTVLKFLRKFNIEVRNNKESKLIQYWKFRNNAKELTKDSLIEEYYVNKLTMQEIADKYKISESAVCRRFKYFKIESRGYCHIGELNPMFGKKRLYITGINNPNYKEKLKINCSYCGKIIEIYPNRIKYTKDFFCNKERFYLWKTENLKGKLNPNWNNGSSFGEYSQEFDSDLKERVRFRDNYRCQGCGCSQLENGKMLDIHHIDYNKQNCDIYNLISLCRSCHSMTNGKREYWKKYYEEIIHAKVSRV